MAVVSSIGFFFYLFWNPLTFPLTTGSSLQSCGWFRSLESFSQGRWGVAVYTAKVSWVAGPNAHCPGASCSGWGHGGGVGWFHGYVQPGNQSKKHFVVWK